MIPEIDYDLKTPDKSDRPTLIFIHGAGGDKNQWKLQFDFYRERGFPVLALSLSGHGKSFYSSKKSISDYVKEINYLISHLKISKYVLIGHSMGGGICLDFALTETDNPPIALILIGTGAKLNVAPVFFELLSTDFNQALRLMGKFSYATETTKAIKMENHKILIKNGAEILIQDLEACCEFDVRDRLNEIDIQSLIICGVEDNMMPVKFSEYLHKKISNSQLVIIPKAGHFVFQEASSEVNDSILKFIKRGMI